MNQMNRQIRCGKVARGVLALLVLGCCLFFPHAGHCEIFGIKDADGHFTPKVDVVVEKKEVVIKKVDPQDKFRSFALKLNPANKNLLRNVASLQVEWIAPGNRVSKPVPFAGPMYDRNTNIFQEPMIKSIGMRIVDTSTHKLFAGKKLADLFAIRVDHQPVVSSESAQEKQSTIRLDGRDVTINVSKSSVVFNENNLKRGEIIDVDNRAGRDQTLGVEIPHTGFTLSQILRKIEQKKIPAEEWNHFTLPAEQGIFIVLIPEPDPAVLSQLNGKDIVIKVYQGNEVRETRRIHITVSPDLVAQPPERSAVSTTAEPPRQQEPVVLPRESSPAPPKPVRAESTAKRTDIRSGGFLLWVIQIANLILLIFLAVYTIFFMLPKVQVLEDRVTKSEMFLHGSREAIREELDQIKREIVQQCQQDDPHE